ncbi:MAG: diguanylate cyclase, partial [Gammaproteobacteria bacterium]
MTYSWLLITSILVFVMQAGFLCLESGKIRSKNSINVAAKNIADFIVSANIFWIFGFALMFGYSNNGFIGTDGFFFGDNQSAFQVSFFIFQMMFCGTAATLVSGAVAERMSFNGYLYVTIILSAFIYPVCGHWAWASSFDSSNIGWLEQLGFVDFAGSTMVHSVGGYVALAAVLIIGPRFGRFDKNMKFPAGNNLTISVLGTLLIWVGWFGFNGGSTLLLTDQVPKILLNTSLSATWGGLASTAIYYYFNRYVNITCIMNGVISGLVAITACCHVVSSVEAMLIGIMAGILLYISTQLLEKLKIDDALGVVPAHLVAGIWGTIALALFADLSLLDNGLDRWQQLKVQLLGIIAIGFYSFSVSYLLLHIVNRFVPLRVSHEDEMVGMNISEHRASSELVVLLDSMHSQQVQGDFSQPVAEEPFTEVGQIANKYNHVIKQVNKEIDKFRTSEKRKVAILDASMDSILTIDLHGKIIEFNHTAERTFGYVKKQVQGHDFIDLFIVEEKQKTVRDSLGYKFSTSYGLLLNQRNHLDLVRNQGERFPAEIAITCVNFDRASSNEYTLHIRDRTRQLKLQNKLKSLAYSDPLTGLYNRTYLLEALTDRLEHSEQQKEGLVLFFLDLDHFKQINDTLGHKSGDELLCEVARRLTLVTRESD